MMDSPVMMISYIDKNKKMKKLKKLCRSDCIVIWHTSEFENEAYV